MTTIVKTKGALRVTNVLHSPGGDKESIAQDMDGVPDDNEGSFPLHNTLSLRVEGEGEITVVATDFAAEIVAGGKIVRIDAGKSRTFDTKGTMLVRQAVDPVAALDTPNGFTR